MCSKHVYQCRGSGQAQHETTFDGVQRHCLICESVGGRKQRLATQQIFDERKLKRQQYAGQDHLEATEVNSEEKERQNIETEEREKKVKG